jgi:SAM-dependent methyltransferase
VKQPGEWGKYAAAVLAGGECPHYAPSADIVAEQQRQIAAATADGGGPPTILILGATPELADLALAAGCRVIRADCSADMFAAAARRQRLAERERELRVVADWLDLHMLASGSIDLVLGDASLNNVPHDHMPALLAELGRVTHPGSRLSLRQIVLPDQPVAAYEFAQAVADYRSGLRTPEEFHKILRFYSFHADAYNPESRVLDARRVFAAILSSYQAGLLSADEFAFLQSRRSGIRHTVYRKSEQVRVLSALGRCEVLQPGAACFYRDLFTIFVVRVGVP